MWTEIGFAVAALAATALAYFHARQAAKCTHAKDMALMQLANQRAENESMLVYVTREKSLSDALKLELREVKYEVAKCSSNDDLRARLERMLSGTLTNGADSQPHVHPAMDA